MKPNLNCAGSDGLQGSTLCGSNSAGLKTVEPGVEESESRSCFLGEELKDSLPLKISPKKPSSGYRLLLTFSSPNTGLSFRPDKLWRDNLVSTSPLVDANESVVSEKLNRTS